VLVSARADRIKVKPVRGLVHGLTAVTVASVRVLVAQVTGSIPFHKHETTYKQSCTSRRIIRVDTRDIHTIYKMH
jgi:hypothetical protein